MSFRRRTRVLPKNHKRAQPGAEGGGNYYRIIVRPKEQFMSFRTQYIGDQGRLKRLAGRRSSGSWATQAWLINKTSAHVENKKLIADSKDVADLIRQLGSQPILEKGDIFITKEQPNIVEKHNSTTPKSGTTLKDDENAFIPKRIEETDYRTIIL